MAKPFTIAELSKAAGIPTSTIRYYERESLLQPKGRTGANYRVYDRESVEQLRFIRAAQGAGFTIADIRTLLDVRQGRHGPCREVRVLIEHRLDRVRSQLEELGHVHEVLDALHRACEQAKDDSECPAIHEIDLSDAPEAPSA